MCDRVWPARCCRRTRYCGIELCLPQRTRRTPIKLVLSSASSASSAVGLVIDMDLSVRIGALTLANPLIAASGCFGYGVEYADLVDLSSLGAVAVKGLFLTEREGHPA